MNSNLRWLTRTAVLLALTVAAQSLRFGQAVTGPLVNAMLFISAFATGTLGGVIVGAVTPWIALAFGILKAPLAPAVPFIMLGNAALVLVFAGGNRLNRTWGRYLGVIAAAVIKFGILAGAIRFVLELNPTVAAALGVPQLFTALGGGVIALVIIAALERVWGPKPAPEPETEKS